MSLHACLGEILTLVQVIFYFLWDNWAYPWYFENRVPLKPALVGGCVGCGVGGGGAGREAYAVSQTTVLHMKRLSQTESPIFVVLCALGFQRQPFLIFIWIAVWPFFGKKLSFWLSACSVWLWCRYFKCVLFPIGVLELKMLGNCIEFWSLPSFLFAKLMHN